MLGRSRQWRPPASDAGVKGSPPPLCAVCHPARFDPKGSAEPAGIRGPRTGVNAPPVASERRWHF